MCITKCVKPCAVSANGIIYQGYQRRHQIGCLQLHRKSEYASQIDPAQARWRDFGHDVGLNHPEPVGPPVYTLRLPWAVREHRDATHFPTESSFPHIGHWGFAEIAGGRGRDGVRVATRTGLNPSGNSDVPVGRSFLRLRKRINARVQERVHCAQGAFQIASFLGGVLTAHKMQPQAAQLGEPRPEI